MYHRVCNDIGEDVYDRNIYATASSLEKNIIMLKKYFTITSLQDLVNRKHNIHNACVITFDDGWLDNYEIAFPILKKHNVPATIFLPTGMIGTDKWFWFERLSHIIQQAMLINHQVTPISEMIMDKIVIHGNAEDMNQTIFNETGTAKELYDKCIYIMKMLPLKIVEKTLDNLETDLNININKSRMLVNWQEVEEMSSEGISFGSHCVSHDILTNLDDDEKRYELSSSRKTLMDKNINYVDCISFPNGNHDQRTLDIARDAGYKLMLTANLTPCGDGESSLLAHRNSITYNISANNNLLAYSIVRAKLMNKLYRS